MQIYSWEIFEKWLWWYLTFAILLLIVIIVSLWYKNFWWVVVILLLLAGYFFFMLKSYTETNMSLGEQSLSIGERNIPYALLKGFLLEQDLTTGILKNIVLVFEHRVEIFTLKDDLWQIQGFVENLSQIVPLLESYEQTTFERFLRKCKL